ncbi:MAG: hypothetical protein ACREKH_15115, partial [Candidatus Rokuibacteriota bacterium]
ARQDHAGPVAHARAAGSDASMRIRALLLVLALLLVAGPASAAITEVGSGSQRAGTAGASSEASRTLAFPANVTSGSRLIVAGAVFLGTGAPAAVVVSDTLSTSYTVLSAVEPIHGNARVFIACGLASSGGANTVTVDPTGSAFISFAIDEFAGADTGACPTVDGGSSTGDSNSPADSITTSVADELIIGVATVGSSSNTVTYTPGGSYTQIAEAEAGATVQTYSAVFRIATTATSYTVDWTLSPVADDNEWIVYTASFKPAGAAARLQLLGVGR